jgi:acyl-CoA synthetase (AMP-forming)/AMP-acid ligase II
MMADILQGIIDQARTGPDLPAVKDSDRALSYAELLDELVRLATGLRDQGVVEGDRVALFLPNSVEFVVAALASLWIGAIFVPLATTDPDARLATMLADCAPALVISVDARDDPSTPQWCGRVPFVSISELQSRSADLAAPIAPSSRTVYAMYTSGTTGTPKGVLIGTDAFGAAVEATSNALGLNRATRTLCVSPFYFDGSFATLFPTLFSGGAVVIRPYSLVFSRTFFNAVVNERITYTGWAGRNSRSRQQIRSLPNAATSLCTRTSKSRSTCRGDRGGSYCHYAASYGSALRTRKSGDTPADP